MIWIWIAAPAVAGALVFAFGGYKLSRGLLLATAALHTSCTVWAWLRPLPLQEAGGWLQADQLSLLFLTIISVLFGAAALHAWTTMGPTPTDVHSWREGGWRLPNQPQRIFFGCLLLFLAAMSWVTVSHHLGLLWVAVEATTLVSTPLIYYHRHQRSLEAAWKYMLICSVGITLALLGNFFLAVATSTASGHEDSSVMMLSSLLRHADQLSPVWLKAAFLLMLVGYGTKMGLAPMHTWLPDAHSEAPSLVSALLSGALLNCAFLAILRMQTVMTAAGLGEFGQQWLMAFGVLSMAWAAALLVSQADFKRMLAYSSVEHMGIVALGVGVGGAAGVGALLHTINHSCTKAALFLVAGNILAYYQSKKVDAVHGLIKTKPFAAALWIAGIVAVIGSPPFGLFVSEWMILKGLLVSGQYLLCAGYLAALLVAFAAMSWTLLQMTFGNAKARPADSGPNKHGATSLIAPALLVLVVLVLGIWQPEPLQDLLKDAANLAGGIQP